MRILLDPDANGGGSSSPAQPVVAKETTPPVVETPPAKGLGEVLKATLDKHLDTQAKDEAKVEETLKADTDTEVKKEEEQKKEEPKVEPAKEEVKEGQPVPYTRFKEVIDAKNTAERQIQDLTPYVQAQQNVQSFCTQYDISPEDFQFWMDIAALSKVNPSKALEALRPQVSTLQSLVGEALPKDLQEKVDAGEIPLEFAKRLAKAEAEKGLTQQHQERFIKQTRAQQEASLQREFANTVGEWETAKKQHDPDFKPKATGAKDEKYEFFLSRFAQDAT